MRKSRSLMLLASLAVAGSSLLSSCSSFPKSAPSYASSGQASKDISFWSKNLTAELPRFGAYGVVRVDSGKKHYESDFAASVGANSFSVQFLDPSAGPWCSITAAGDDVTVESDEKKESGSGREFMEKQLGIALSPMELQNLLVGRPYVKDGDSVRYKKKMISADGTSVAVDGDKILWWKGRGYRVYLFDHRRHGDFWLPGRIEVRAMNRGRVLIEYASFSFDPISR